MDMIAEPAMLHRAMSILEAGHREIIAQYQSLGLLQLNNDGEYHSSGGTSYIDTLPAAGYSGGSPPPVRPVGLGRGAGDGAGLTAHARRVHPAL